jgi:hypothetical protein
MILLLALWFLRKVTTGQKMANDCPSGGQPEAGSVSYHFFYFSGLLTFAHP